MDRRDKEKKIEARQALEVIEDELIYLIQNSTHHGALELLTQSLLRIRAAHKYLDGDDFC